jgi:hypothetical protein
MAITKERLRELIAMKDDHIQRWDGMKNGPAPLFHYEEREGYVLALANLETQEQITSGKGLDAACRCGNYSGDEILVRLQGGPR